MLDRNLKAIVPRAVLETAIAPLLTAIAFVLTLILFVPFGPAMPQPDIDSSWQYAMNTAVAKHMVIGKDIVFTFGPLASVYSRQYHPATDGPMLFYSALIAAGLFGALTYICAPRRRGWLVIFPILLTQFWLRDAIFMTLPLVMLCAAEKQHEGGTIRLVVLTLSTMACGALPLIKGTFTPFVAGCIVLAVLATWNRSRAEAMATMLVPVIFVCLSWVAAGQPITALPNFFIAQGPIVSGYTEAMSASGNVSDLKVYGLVALLLLALWLRPVNGNRWRVVAAVAVMLLLCFKAGFVRHDGHALIAASALTLIGYVLFLRNDTFAGLAGVVLGILGWLAIANSYLSVSPWDSIERVSTQIYDATYAAAARVKTPGELRRHFEDANRAIRLTLPLPSRLGTVDLYPSALSALLATDMTWSPRPIMQSYSAYNNQLLAANRRHLELSPPETIFFGIDSIDQRFPSLEDSASWPLLLGKYEPVGLVGIYAELRKRARPVSVDAGPAEKWETASVGSSIPITHTGRPIWAYLDVKPTLLGRLLAAVYKDPPLYISVGFANRTSATYRMIPSIARTGFLLSPVISSAEDFVALQSTRAPELLEGRYPISVGLLGTSGTRLLWSKTYSVSLTRLPFPTSESADRLLMAQSEPAHSLSTLPVGGDCNIEALNGVDVGTTARSVSPLWRIRGWAMLSNTQDKANTGVQIAITAPDGDVRMYPARKIARDDVAAAYHRKDGSDLGYEAIVDANSLHGTYQIQIAQRDGNQLVVCGQKVLSIYRE
ncbi:hypothetical protein B0G81_5930 [Paraburkholderia sp. BL6665CI2N2]|uniref:hypothetical protein n=1 Tax=Paraburkholderia sp. BL6665CI2N2 TaxID=1938806 RepID=UPI0010670D94|nr:hypothetical protein [Paraburkholderia sp. BL6665CI2N2]TDY25467.1 hypothetical protein B0G81_5930 [Paraburkholderia sp. BL6665CI2N2]